MKIAIERLPLEALELAPIARAALERRLSIDGVHVALAASEIERPSERFDARARATLVAELATTLDAVNAPNAARASLEKLRQPNACAIVTGQQPGFLCSPLYDVYKALTAIAIAALLEREWKSPVVPLFWNHGDDHDVAEVHHAFVLNANLDLQKVALAGLSSGRQPFSRIVLDETAQKLAATRELLATSLPQSPQIERALELLMPKSGETIARAFSRGMTNLLGELGLVVFEPDSRRLESSRELAALVASEPLRALVLGADEMRALGFEPAIDPKEAALCFRLDSRGRRALRATPEGWLIDGEETPISTADLVRAIESSPTEFSAGALLRPLVQDRVLPVAAYVGGWGELAYHAELGRLRRATSSPRTAFVPRISCTLIDPETRASLDKLNLSARELFLDRSKLDVEDDTPEPAVIAKLRELGRRIESDVNGLREELEMLDKGLAQSLKRSAFQARSVVDTLREKAERVNQNISGKGRRHVRRVQNSLFPRNEPQERVLGPLPFCARFGTEWIEALARELDPFDPRPLLVSLDVSETPTP